MSTQKPFVRPDPSSKEQLRAMLAEAVRNTQPELNTTPAFDPQPKERPTKAAPAKPMAKGCKGRDGNRPMRKIAKRRGA